MVITMHVCTHSFGANHTTIKCAADTPMVGKNHGHAMMCSSYRGLDEKGKKRYTEKLSYVGS